MISHYSNYSFTPADTVSDSTRAGNIGGLTDSARHPKINSTAAPQTRPWHAPIPQRVCNFALRQSEYFANCARLTSSHRHTIVSGATSVRNSSRNANVRANNPVNFRAAARSEKSVRAFAAFPAAA
jgi:hypothetical protein